MMMASTSFPIFVKVLKLLTATFFICHYLASCWVYVGRHNYGSWIYTYSDVVVDTTGIHELEDGASFWLKELPAVAVEPTDDDEECDPSTSADDCVWVLQWSVGKIYRTAIYWAITTMTTVGYGDVCPQSDQERQFVIIGMIVGASFYGYIIATVTSLVTSVDANTEKYVGLPPTRASAHEPRSIANCPPARRPPPATRYLHPSIHPFIHSSIHPTPPTIASRPPPSHPAHHPTRPTTIPPHPPGTTRRCT